MFESSLLPLFSLTKPISPKVGSQTGGQRFVIVLVRRNCPENIIKKQPRNQQLCYNCHHYNEIPRRQQYFTFYECSYVIYASTKVFNFGISNVAGEIFIRLFHALLYFYQLTVEISRKFSSAPIAQW